MTVSSHLSVSRLSHRLLTMLALSVLVFVMAGCGGGARPEPTPTPLPTATPTPLPTATPVPTVASGASESSEAAATAVPTPVVTIPNGFTPEVDDALGYSLALPRGYTNLDLRSNQFRTMANTFGLAEQLTPLTDFLNSPAGESVGMVGVTDLAGMMFGGLPTLLNVSVIDAPGATSEQVEAYIADFLATNGAMLGDLAVEELGTTTINNLPAVDATVAGDLTSVGMDAQVFGRVVGLVANDNIYVLTQLTEAGKRAEKEPIFEQIVGTFRPE